MDAQVQRIINAVKQSGQLENTLIIFTSDHGLAVGSHGLFGKQNMYEHTIGVPLVIRGPGIRKDTIVKAQCYLRDLFPTVCDLTGLPIPETIDGKSLRPVLDGTVEEVVVQPEMQAFARARSPGDRVVVAIQTALAVSVEPAG